MAISRTMNRHRSDGQPRALLALARDHATQIASLDVLDREEVLAVDLADLEDRGDVGVLQLDGDLRLVDEALDELLVGDEVAAGSS